jgi:hypothetical protein
MANTPRTTVGPHGSNRSRTVFPPHGQKTQVGTPVVVVSPFITGTPLETAILTLNYGQWSPVPTSFVVQWLRSGAPIQGATGSSYVLTSSDVGSTISVRVTGSNQSGSTTVITASTPVVATIQPPTFPPAFSTQPTVIGTPVVGSSLSGSPGIATGNPAPSLAFLWLLDGVATTNTTQTYVIGPTDAGKRLSFRVTATNAFGSASATSTQTSPVATLGPAPQFVLGINLSGMEYGDDTANYAVTIPDSQLDEVKAKGFTDVRLPISWDRIETPAARTVLDPTNWGNVVDALTRMKAKGLKCILDIHSFGARNVLFSGTSTLLSQTDFSTGWSYDAATVASNGFLEDASNSTHRMHYSFNANAGTITFKARVKAGTKGFARLILLPTTFDSSNEVRVNLSTGALVGTNTGLTGTKAVSAGNGYWDITLVGTAATTREYIVFLQAHADATSDGYLGTLGQQPLLVASVSITNNASTRYYVGIGALGPDGSQLLPPSALADTITRIINDLKTRSLLDALSAIDPINEPDAVQSDDLLFQTHQLTINAARTAGYTGPLLIEGKPYSGAVTFPERNPNLWKLTDPANNLIFSGHCYGDYDNSGAATGTPMHWDVQGGKPVEIPVDPLSNPGEVVDEQTLVRRCDHMLQWLKSKGITRMHVGELGVGRDSIHWNNQLRNLFAWAQTNKVWLSLWAGGPAWGDGYELRLTQYTDGLQAEQMAVIDELKGNPVPTVYRVTVSPRIASGSSTIPVTIKYNGLIPSAITFTPSDNGAGGSFSPTTITTDTTENWTGTVTYTPAANKNGTITVANNKGWAVPAALPFSSYADKFTAIEGEGIAVNRVFEPWQRVYKSYTGPLIQLWKQVGGADVVQDFGRATGVETLTRLPLRRGAQARTAASFASPRSMTSRSMAG